MIKQKIQIDTVKTDIECNLGKAVSVLVNLGRNKFTQFEGVITNCYPALFTINPSVPYNGRTCFSYSDVVGGIVKIQLKDN